jgi:hypothetical protein
MKFNRIDLHLAVSAMNVYDDVYNIYGLMPYRLKDLDAERDGS